MVIFREIKQEGRHNPAIKVRPWVNLSFVCLWSTCLLFYCCFCLLSYLCYRCCSMHCFCSWFCFFSNDFTMSFQLIQYNQGVYTYKLSIIFVVGIWNKLKIVRLQSVFPNSLFSLTEVCKHKRRYVVTIKRSPHPVPRMSAGVLC